MNQFWHICNGRALAKIKSEGLVPMLGARSVRFKNEVPLIHVCDSLDSALGLSKIPLWATNPENERFGQFLIEVLSDEIGRPDPYYKGGIILTQSISVDRVFVVDKITEPIKPQAFSELATLKTWLLEILRSLQYAFSWVH
jgi:hypothetical protein